MINGLEVNGATFRDEGYNNAPTSVNSEVDHAYGTIRGNVDFCPAARWPAVARERAVGAGMAGTAEDPPRPHLSLVPPSARPLGQDAADQPLISSSSRPRVSRTIERTKKYDTNALAA